MLFQIINAFAMSLIAVAAGMTLLFLINRENRFCKVLIKIVSIIIAAASLLLVVSISYIASKYWSSGYLTIPSRQKAVLRAPKDMAEFQRDKMSLQNLEKDLGLEKKETPAVRPKCGTKPKASTVPSKTTVKPTTNK